MHLFTECYKCEGWGATRPQFDPPGKKVKPAVGYCMYSHLYLTFLLSSVISHPNRLLRWAKLLYFLQMNISKNWDATAVAGTPAGQSGLRKKKKTKKKVFAIFQRKIILNTWHLPKTIMSVYLSINIVLLFGKRMCTLAFS